MVGEILVLLRACALPCAGTFRCASLEQFLKSTRYPRFPKIRNKADISSNHSLTQNASNLSEVLTEHQLLLSFCEKLIEFGEHCGENCKTLSIFPNQNVGKVKQLGRQLVNLSLESWKRIQDYTV